MQFKGAIDELLLAPLGGGKFICNLETCESRQDCGFWVAAISCAAEVFGVIEKHEGLAGLVTDIDLGPGADGFELARRGRAAYPRLPVIFISATEDGRQACEGVEGSEYIAKPFHPGEVVAALNRTIHRAAT